MNDFLLIISRGIFLALVYLELTKANDTTLNNIFVFSLSYTIMFITAGFIGIDPVLVTNAFITKTVFTAIDERVRKNNPNEPFQNKK